MKKTIIGLLIGCMLLGGCGNSQATYNAKEDSGAYIASETAQANYDMVDYDYEYEEGAYDAAEASFDESNGGAETVTFAEGKKIIYQSNVVLETKTYTETYNKLLELINKNGGYIEYESYNNEMRSYLRNNSGKGNLVIATNCMTIRIPSKNYSSFMQDGLSLGNVLNRYQTIEDKTSEYNTNKSYVDILNDEAEYLAKQLDVLEKELREAQANDKHYDEIITNMKDIASRKAQVEKELVPYKRAMDDIDEKASYSTITMELREVDEFTVVEEVEEETFGTKVKNSWNKAMTNLSNMLQNTVLFLIAIIPAVVYLLIFAVIIFVILFIIKKITKKKTIKEIFVREKRPINMMMPINNAPIGNAPMGNPGIYNNVRTNVNPVVNANNAPVAAPNPNTVINATPAANVNAKPAVAPNATPAANINAKPVVASNTNPATSKAKTSKQKPKEEKK